MSSLICMVMIYFKHAYVLKLLGAVIANHAILLNARARAYLLHKSWFEICFENLLFQLVKINR